MIARLGPWARRLWRSSLLVLALLMLWPGEAQAARPRAEARAAAPGDCTEIVRSSIYGIPDLVKPPDKPENYGDLVLEGVIAMQGTRDVSEVAEILRVTFCEVDTADQQAGIPAGSFRKTQDRFPYDSPDVCVSYYPDEGAAPDVLPQAADIDRYGIVYYQVDKVNHTTYCRDGAGWKRQLAPGEDPGPGPGCVEVIRWTYRPVGTITPPDSPESHGRLHPVVIDPRFKTTYCMQGGLWKVTADGFPYDQENLCLKITYDADAHGGATPPDRITPLDDIDRYGQVDSVDGAYGTENHETYCRSGSEWTRTARADDYPEGPWQEWAKDCKTILLDNGVEAPRRMTQNPDDIGESDFGRFLVSELSAMDPARLPTYCRRSAAPLGCAVTEAAGEAPAGVPAPAPAGSTDLARELGEAGVGEERGPAPAPPDCSTVNTWYRVDDYPLQEGIPQLRDRLGPPAREDRCVVIQFPTTDHFPEVLPPLGNPGDLGGYMSVTLFEGDYPRERLYCYVNGRWRRSDVLLECDDDDADDPSTILPEGCWTKTGQSPSNFDITYAAGLTDVRGRFIGQMTDGFYQGGKWILQGGLWAIDQAYELDPEKYDQVGLLVGGDYKKNLIDVPQFHVAGFIWLGETLYVIILVIRGKPGVVGREVVVLVVSISLSSQMMVHRAEYMRSGWDFMNAGSADLLVAGQGITPTGDNRQTLSEAVDAVQVQFGETFIANAADELNYGHLLGTNNDCAKARNVVIATGPHGSDDLPRDLLKDAGCEREAEYNEVPTMQRAGGAAASGFASGAAGLGLLLAALTVLGAKGLAIVLMALLPFAGAAAGAPGPLRRAGIFWGTLWLQVFLIVLGMGVLLSMMLLGTGHILENTAQASLVEKFSVMGLAVVGIGVGRRKLLASSGAAASRLADHLTTAGLGGGGGGGGGGLGGGAGANLAGMDRGARMAGVGAAWVGGTALALGGGVVARKWTRRLNRKNILKARRQGDRRAATMERTFWATGVPGPPGGTDGATPRGGYNIPSTSPASGNLGGGSEPPVSAATAAALAAPLAPAASGPKTAATAKAQAWRDMKGRHRAGQPPMPTRASEAATAAAAPSRFIREIAVAVPIAPWTSPMVRAADIMHNRLAVRRGRRMAYRNSMT